MAEGQGANPGWIATAAQYVEHGAQYVDKGVKAWDTIHKAESVVKEVKEAAWFKDLSAGEKATEYYNAAKTGLSEAKDSGLAKTLGKATQVLTIVEGGAQFVEGAKMVYDGKTKEGTQKILGGSYDLLTGVVPGSGIAEMAINKGLDKLYAKELGPGDHKDGHLKEVITKTANDGLETAGKAVGDGTYKAVEWAKKEGTHLAGEVKDHAVAAKDAVVAEAHEAKDAVKHGWAAFREAAAHPIDTYRKLEAVAPQGVEVARAGPDR